MRLSSISLFPAFSGILFIFLVAPCKGVVLKQNGAQISLGSTGCVPPCTSSMDTQKLQSLLSTNIEQTSERTKYSSSEEMDFNFIDGKGPERTILFSDGSAQGEVKLELIVKPGDSLDTIDIIANDTNILTSSIVPPTESFNSEILKNNHTRYNMTLTFYFERTVGSVAVMIVAHTINKGVVSEMVNFYVFGYIGISLPSNGQTSVVTGFEAQPITFESPRDVFLQFPQGALVIPVVYQPPGPDVDHDNVQQQHNHHGQQNKNHMNEHGQQENKHSHHDHYHYHSDYYGHPMQSPDFDDVEQSFIPILPLPKSVIEMMSMTYAQVSGETIGSSSDILEWNNQECKYLTPAHFKAEVDENDPFGRLNTYMGLEKKDKSQRKGQYVFDNEKCAVGYDVDDGSILVKVKPFKSGYANILLTTPALQINGEVSELSIRIKVKDHVDVMPFVILDGDRSIEFDFYGREIFSLELNNTLAPPQMANATDYFVSLPNGRYARADFSLSSLSRDIQRITFVTLAPGDEDTAVLENIQIAGIHKPKETGENATDNDTKLALEATPEAGHKIPGSGKTTISTVSRLSKNIDEDMSFGDNDPEPQEAEKSERWLGLSFPWQRVRVTVEPVAVSTPEPVPVILQSYVFVLIPPKKTYHIAESSSGGLILTEFASKSLANVKNSHKGVSITYVRVSVVLYDYSTKNFSEHKSEQIGQTIADVVGRESGTPTHAELTQIQERPTSIIVTYDLEAPHNGSKIATTLTQVDNEIGSALERDAMLRTGTIAIYDASVLSAVPDAHLKGDGSQRSGLSGGATNGLIGAIVALCLILSIPCLVVLFGCIASQRKNQHVQREEQQLQVQSSGTLSDD